MAQTNPIILPLEQWIAACTSKGGEVSRNTIAVGIVVLDHLRRKCPLEPSEVQSARGEIKGARSGLGAVLEKYALPAKYLKEVTTRAGHQDGQKLFEALAYGRDLAKIGESTRDEFLTSAIETLVVKAIAWLHRQHLKISCDPRDGPATWVETILAEAKGRSGGKVEQHLIRAKLERRHPGIEIANNPGHAGDVQTGRPGDFLVGTTAYHVTASPGSAVIEKCAANLAAGLHPFLLVPRDQEIKARSIADDKGILRRMTINCIEDFIADNIVEHTDGASETFIETLRSVIEVYNRRLQEVETDLSLRIEIN